MLARWMDFARASVAFPDDAEGRRWKASVAPVITLQAVTLALGEADERLEGDERALAADRAAELIRRETVRLHEAWYDPVGAAPMPEGVDELIRDAERALRGFEASGTEWVVVEERVVARDPTATARALVDAGFEGDMWAALPGTMLFRGAPLAFIRSRDAAVSFAGCESRRSQGPRQVYRQVDASGRPVRDLVAALEGWLPPGQPLLTAVIEGGAIVFKEDARRGADRQVMQEKALEGRTLPVVEAASGEE
ncbi:MAG: hypothetical protein VYC34_01070 [Planctomycetota bacterium]|nr:hypothetical protein [Planctomycetota bacterium]